VASELGVVTLNLVVCQDLEGTSEKRPEGVQLIAVKIRIRIGEVARDCGVFRSEETR
jgi:hypothetical protein